MGSSPAPDESNTPVLYPAWPGYWTLKRRLECLLRFKYLIIHRERWAPELDSAPTLDELFPGENLQEGTMEAIHRIEEEIRQTMKIVHGYLERCGVPTTRNVREYDPIEQRQVRIPYNLVVDYFTLSRDAAHRRANFEELIHRLDMGIGLHKNAIPLAKRALFNPITWMSYAIRIPITALERAGMMADRENQKTVIKAYVWTVQSGVLLIIALVAWHYGAKIPWGDAINWLIKLAPK